MKSTTAFIVALTVSTILFIALEQTSYYKSTSDTIHNVYCNISRYQLEDLNDIIMNYDVDCAMLTYNNTVTILYNLKHVDWDSTDLTKPVPCHYIQHRCIGFDETWDCNDKNKAYNVYLGYGHIDEVKRTRLYYIDVLSYGFMSGGFGFMVFLMLSEPIYNV